MIHPLFRQYWPCHSVIPSVSHSDSQSLVQRKLRCKCQSAASHCNHRIPVLFAVPDIKPRKHQVDDAVAATGSQSVGRATSIGLPAACVFSMLDFGIFIVRCLMQLSYATLVYINIATVLPSYCLSLSPVYCLLSIPQLTVYTASTLISTVYTAIATV